MLELDENGIYIGSELQAENYAYTGAGVYSLPKIPRSIGMGEYF